MIVFNVFDEKKSGEVPGVITFMEKNCKKLDLGVSENLKQGKSFVNNNQINKSNISTRY